MKIIDDKGMFFGKINIIDFLVLLFILCFLPMLWYGWKIYNRPPPPQINWEQKYNEEVAKIKTFCNEHKRASICREIKR